MSFVGISNQYNNCFINSALQILINLDFLEELLHNDEILSALIIQKKIGQQLNINQLYQHLLDSKKINYCQQGDCHEILLWILHNNPKIEKLFTGKSIKTIICQNGHIFNHNETFTYIPLVDNIDNSFMEYINPILIKDYQCDKCHKITNAQIINKIIKLPIVLTFHSPYKNKQNSIEIINPNYRITTTNGERFYYQLYGTVNHQGSQNGGHYYCQIIKNDKVYEINDTSIKNTRFQSNNIISIYLVNKSILK